MQTSVLLLLLSSYFAGSCGLKCYSCSDKSSYDGEGQVGDNCYDVTTTSSPICTLPTPYCQTMFTIQDGVVTSVTRGCQTGASDEDLNTAVMPKGDICTVALDPYGNPTSNSQCYISCNSDNCNSVKASGLKQCSPVCDEGSCNYITGKCVCSGQNCSNTSVSASLRNCYQCTSETDLNCSSNPARKTGCPTTEQYCATTITKIFDQAMEVVSTIVTRGCSSKLVAGDECAYTNIYTDSPISDTSVGYNEYTCYSTCDTDSCNNNNANGNIESGESQNFQCVQCTGTGNGDCEPTSKLPAHRSMCGGTSSHFCKTTVSYLLSERKDIDYSDENPPYMITNIKRECASQATQTGCTFVTSLVGTLYTCTETCETDGCNTGWPARPKCIQCSSGDRLNRDGYDHCLQNPPLATTCPKPYQQYCYIHDQGMTENKQSSVQGYPRQITRGCSYKSHGTWCTTQTINNQNVQTCNRTCDYDGCNYGNDATARQFSAIVTVLALFFGLLAQMLP